MGCRMSQHYCGHRGDRSQEQSPSYQCANSTSLAGQLGDYTSGMVPGQLRNNWQNTLNANTTLPRPALSGIRLYERFFYLSPPTP